MIAAHRSLTDYILPKRRRCRADVRTVEKEQTGPVLGHVGSPGHLYPSLQDTGALCRRNQDFYVEIPEMKVQGIPPGVTQSDNNKARDMAQK